MLELWLSEIFDSLALAQNTGRKNRLKRLRRNAKRLLTVTTRQLFIPLAESNSGSQELFNVATPGRGILVGTLQVVVAVD